jgi:hypothetical protein
MIHEDLRMQPKRLKKKKEKDRSVSVGYISESTGSCNERQAWQTSDGQPDSHHKSKKKKKNKEKHYDAEDCKRKGKLDEGIFEGFELLDTEGRQKGIQPNRRKKKKKDRSAGLGYISEDTGTCNERQAWQTSDGAQPDGHHKSKKKKKNKETHYDAEDCKRKRKLNENVFEGSELLDTEGRQKDIQPNRRKKKKEKDRSASLGYISEGTGTCNERQAWQTSDGGQPDSHHKSKKKKKNKETHYDAEDCKRKRKLDENVFEGSELLDNKRRKKDKHEKMH